MTASRNQSLVSQGTVLVTGASSGLQPALPTAPRAAVTI